METSGAIYLKSSTEIAKMRRGGHMLQRVLKEVCDAAVEGVTTNDLDRIGYSRIKELGAKPAFLGQYGFPKTLCISVNEEVVHGIPGKRVLKNGDLVSLDCGLILDGFYTDTAYTVAVGEPSPEAKVLLDTTLKALYAGIAAAKYDGRIGDISKAIQAVVEGAGFHCAEKYTGHGVGRKLHEEPKVENVYADRGARIGHGLTIAIEPMVNIGTGKTRELNDRWTVVTKDGSLSAHFEHTIAITRDGVEVLTRDPELGFF